MTSESGDRILDLPSMELQLRAFAEDRDWQQFHNPKNLAMALGGEAGELLEIFQWLTPKQSADVANMPDLKLKVSEELADILQYVIRIADLVDVDLVTALEAKLESNKVRYPVDKVKGSAQKVPQGDNT